MWIRYGGQLINIERFLCFFIRENRLYGSDETGKIHLILNARDEEEVRLAMDLLGDKLWSE